jgi:hypothetical protein
MTWQSVLLACTLQGISCSSLANWHRPVVPIESLFATSTSLLLAPTLPSLFHEGVRTHRQRRDRWLHLPIDSICTFGHIISSPVYKSKLATSFFF